MMMNGYCWMDTVDSGWLGNPNQQLIDGKHPMVSEVSIRSGGTSFLERPILSYMERFSGSGGQKSVIQ